MRTSLLTSGNWGTWLRQLGDSKWGFVGLVVMEIPSGCWQFMALGYCGKIWSHGKGMDSNLGGRAFLSCSWKNISKTYSRFVSNIRYETGKRDKIRFWEDLWWGDVKFCQKILADLFNLQ